MPDTLARLQLGLTAFVLLVLGVVLVMLVRGLVRKLTLNDTPRFESHWGGLGGGMGGWNANGSLALCFFTLVVLLAFVGVAWQGQPKAEKPKEETSKEEAKKSPPADSSTKAGEPDPTAAPDSVPAAKQTK